MAPIGYTWFGRCNWCKSNNIMLKWTKTPLNALAWKREILRPGFRSEASGEVAADRANVHGVPGLQGDRVGTAHLLHSTIMYTITYSMIRSVFPLETKTMAWSSILIAQACWWAWGGWWLDVYYFINLECYKIYWGGEEDDGWMGFAPIWAAGPRCPPGFLSNSLRECFIFTAGHHFHLLPGREW